MKKIGARSTRTDSTNHRAVQTEAGFYPGDIFVEKVKYIETQAWIQLRAVRENLQLTFTNLSTNIYDLMAWKDIAFEGTHPNDGFGAALVSDVTLISSKIFRRTVELANNLSCFFTMVFGEEFSDEHFHFVELRIAQRELKRLNEYVQAKEQELSKLKDEVVLLRSKVVEQSEEVNNLSSNNVVLTTKTVNLEDQMALLFEQLADDWIYYNEQQIRKVVQQSSLQDTLSSVRSVFSQSIDALQHRMQYFEQTLQEIREDKLLFQLGDEKDGARAKLKSLQVHVHQIINRFDSVREGLLNTASELHTALVDKKRVINFSIQHLKAYELQNVKLKNVRLKLYDLRQTLNGVKRLYERTFMTGAVLRIDAKGDITVEVPPPKWVGGNENPAKNVKEVKSRLRELQDSAYTITEILSQHDEHKELMKAISLSVPTSTRVNKNQRKAQIQQVGNILNVAIGMQSTATTRMSERMDPAPNPSSQAPLLPQYSLQQLKSLQQSQSFRSNIPNSPGIQQESIHDTEPEIDETTVSMAAVEFKPQWFWSIDRLHVSPFLPEDNKALEDAYEEQGDYGLVRFDDGTEISLSTRLHTFPDGRQRHVHRMGFEPSPAKVLITSLSPLSQEGSLVPILTEFGTLKTVRVLRDHLGNSLCCAIAYYASELEAVDAVHYISSVDGVSVTASICEPSFGRLPYSPGEQSSLHEHINVDIANIGVEVASQGSEASSSRSTRVGPIVHPDAARIANHSNGQAGHRGTAAVTAGSVPVPGTRSGSQRNHRASITTGAGGTDGHQSSGAPRTDNAKRPSRTHNDTTIPSSNVSLPVSDRNTGGMKTTHIQDDNSAITKNASFHTAKIQTGKDPESLLQSIASFREGMMPRPKSDIPHAPLEEKKEDHAQEADDSATYYKINKEVEFQTKLEEISNARTGSQGSVRVVLSNLQHTVTEHEIQIELDKLVKVNAISVARDARTGRSLGFAFAWLESRDAAQRLINDTTMINGNPIVVGVADLNTQSFRIPRAVNKSPPPPEVPAKGVIAKSIADAHSQIAKVFASMAADQKSSPPPPARNNNPGNNIESADSHPGPTEVSVASNVTEESTINGEKTLEGPPLSAAFHSQVEPELGRPLQRNDLNPSFYIQLTTETGLAKTDHRVGKETRSTSTIAAPQRSCSVQMDPTAGKAQLRNTSVQLDSPPFGVQGEKGVHEVTHSTEDHRPTVIEHGTTTVASNVDSITHSKDADDIIDIESEDGILKWLNQIDSTGIFPPLVVAESTRDDGRTRSRTQVSTGHSLHSHDDGKTYKLPKDEKQFKASLLAIQQSYSTKLGILKQSYENRLKSLEAVIYSLRTQFADLQSHLTAGVGASAMSTTNISHLTGADIFIESVPAVPQDEGTERWKEKSGVIIEEERKRREAHLTALHHLITSEPRTDEKASPMKNQLSKPPKTKDTESTNTNYPSIHTPFQGPPLKTQISRDVQQGHAANLRVTGGVRLSDKRLQVVDLYANSYTKPAKQP